MGCGSSIPGKKSPFADGIEMQPDNSSSSHNKPHHHNSDTPKGEGRTHGHGHRAKAVDNGPLTEIEIETLKKRFQQLAKQEKDDGMIDKKEFLSILQFEDSLFMDRIFSLFDGDHSGAISMDEFIKALGILGPKGRTDQKIKLSFRMWDLNNDGVIAKSELCKLMRSSLEASSLLISADQMNMLIDATFGLADCDNNGSITLAEYEKLVELFPGMISHMTLDLSGKLYEDP